MVESDDPKVAHHPLYQKFNTDRLNDYCQIILETNYDRNQEVLVIKVLLGHITGWDTEIPPLCVPMNLAHKLHRQNLKGERNKTRHVLIRPKIEQMSYLPHNIKKASSEIHFCNSIRNWSTRKGKTHHHPT